MEITDLMVGDLLIWKEKCEYEEEPDLNAICKVNTWEDAKPIIDKYEFIYSNLATVKKLKIKRKTNKKK